MFGNQVIVLVTWFTMKIVSVENMTFLIEVRDQ